VRAGSIVPMAAAFNGWQKTVPIASVRVYPGADASFTVFQDDGTTYAYEHGGGSVTKLTWDDKTHRLKHEGVELEGAKVEVMGK